MKEKKAVKEETSVAVADETAVAVSSYGATSGGGFENTSQRDILMPFIYLLQSDSPIVLDKKADAGQWLNSATGEVFDEFPVVPCSTNEEYVEWVPRKKGGGLVGKFSPLSPEVRAASQNEWVTPDGNDMKQTFYIFGIQINEDGSPGMPCVIPFASTKIKHYRALMLKIQYFTIIENKKKVSPGLYCNRLKLTSFDDKNKAGDRYKNVVISPLIGDSLEESLIPLGDELLAASMECCRLVKEGAMKPDYENSQQEGTGNDPASSENF